eukprot:s8025_g2.t1
MEMAAEQDVDIAVETVFGNLARNSAQSFAAALLEPSQTESERPPKAAKVELGKRGRPSDNSNSGGRNGQGHKGQGKGGHKAQPQMAALVRAMGKLLIRQETQLQILKQNSAKGQGKGGHKAQPQMAALVRAMGKLLIRQETQLQILKQNSAWQVYLQPGTAGPIPVLFGGLQGAGENQIYGGTGSGCPTAHPLPDTAALPSSPRQQCHLARVCDALEPLIALLGSSHIAV